MRMSLSEMGEAVGAINAEKGWSFKEDEIPEKLMLMVTEISEIMEEYRRLDPWGSPALVYHKDGKPEGIPIECADLFIRLLHFCHTLGIDLEAAFLEKIEFNKTRPFRHGGLRA